MSEIISILVTDDDPDILFATARVLRSAGYTVYEADTGEGCIHMVREKAPDLVLLDVLLPDTNGDEVCRRIKTDADLCGTYVVLLSGVKTESDDQSKGLEIGADGYIARPINRRELLARVQAMARIISAERERDRLIEKLEKALADIKTLNALLPICANCKNIRNDKGYWEQIETYITEHSNTLFSHSICPKCLKELYGDLADEITQ
ncbi:MAG: response regulator [Rhodocyclaceae bacterium]|nr:response regulator [Rhodocyclaceae bacterium]